MIVESELDENYDNIVFTFIGQVGGMFIIVDFDTSVKDILLIGGAKHRRMHAK